MSANPAIPASNTQAGKPDCADAGVTERGRAAAVGEAIDAGGGGAIGAASVAVGDGVGSGMRGAVGTWRTRDSSTVDEGSGSGVAVVRGALVAVEDGAGAGMASAEGGEVGVSVATGAGSVTVGTAAGVGVGAEGS